MGHLRSPRTFSAAIAALGWTAALALALFAPASPRMGRLVVVATGVGVTATGVCAAAGRTREHMADVKWALNLVDEQAEYSGPYLVPDRQERRKPAG